MSRFRTLTMIAALAAAGFVSAVAVAQERSSPPRPPTPQIPSGSYQQSCRGASMSGTMLSAQCTNRQGRPVSSRIDTNSCRGRNIINDDGRLACPSSGGGGPQPPVPVLPSGSYQQSCRGASMSGTMLSAQCTNRQGRPVFSRIDTNSCRGRNIINDDGRLACPSGGGPRPPVPVLPSGSYQQSCRGITMSGTMLSAQCTNRQGRPVSSRLDVSSCRGRDVINDNGRLACSSGGGGGGGGGGVSPPTGGNFEAILYTSANFQGRFLRVAGPAVNLAFWPGFNDNVRSIQIVRGRAQICVDAQFRGRCETIGRSYRDLNAIGMANRISSVR